MGRKKSDVGKVEKGEEIIDSTTYPCGCEGECTCGEGGDVVDESEFPVERSHNPKKAAPAEPVDVIDSKAIIRFPGDEKGEGKLDLPIGVFVNNVSQAFQNLNATVDSLVKKQNEELDRLKAENARYGKIIDGFFEKEKGGEKKGE